MKAEIVRQSALNLTRPLQEVEEWSERGILERSEEPFEAARKVRPRPDV